MTAADDHPSGRVLGDDNPFAAPARIDASAGFDPATHYYALATRDSRIGAYMIDVAYAGTAALAAYLAYELWIADRVEPGLHRILSVAVPWLAAVAVATLVFGPSIARDGQSPGKRKLGIKIVRVEDHGRIGWLRGVVLRLLCGKLLLTLVPLYGLLDLIPIFAEPRRCIHDYIGASIVVRAEPVARYESESASAQSRS